MKLPKRRILALVAGGALTLGTTAPANAWHYTREWQDGYRVGHSDGYKSGFSNGENRGYSRGYDRGEDVGYDKGYDTGKSDGITEGYASGKSDGITEGYASGYSDGEADGFASGKAVGINEGIATGYADGFSDGREFEQTLIAESGNRPALAVVPELTAGMTAPTLDVGKAAVSLGTVSYSNSIGSSDSFSVGAATNIGATASAQSTPDYKVTSNATFGIGTNTMINQVIGSSVGETSKVVTPTSPITGSFNKSYSPDTIDNTVEVAGIGTNSTIQAGKSSKFKTDIVKGRSLLPDGSLVNPGAGTANGSASGSVGTTTTASANSSQFVSSFAQAY